MNQRKMAFLLCASILLGTRLSHAQRYIGTATSEYNTINALYLNPANIADCKEKISVNLFSINVGIDNDFGKLGSFSNLGSAGGSNGFENIFSNSGKNSFSLLAPAADVRGPSVLYKINARNTIALTTRLRVINQLNDFDQSLFNTITSPNFVSGKTYSVQAQAFNWTAHLWTEVGVSYGSVLFKNDNSELKAGVTLRYLGGIGYLSLKSDNLDLNYASGKDSFYAASSNLTYTSNIISSHSAVLNGISGSSLLGNFFGSNQGSGIGADAGLVYLLNFKHHDQYDDEGKGLGYQLKISASVTDIGSVSYGASNNSTVNATGNGYLTGKGLSDNATNAQDFKNYITSHGFNGDTSAQSTKIYLPTALLLSADYKVYGNLCINATYVNNLANRNNYGNSYYNQLTFTPRYDTKLFTIGLPITYSMLANDVKMGLGLRIGGFFLGSDDMLALFGGNQYGFNVYFGGYIPLFTHANKDVNP